MSKKNQYLQSEKNEFLALFTGVSPNKRVNLRAFYKTPIILELWQIAKKSCFRNFHRCPLKLGWTELLQT